jgi:predicted nuclease of predicted toxin-antitoxin system
MSLLFDQNISFRVVRHLSSVYPGCVQVREIGLEDSTDIGIWRFAREKDLSIVTFDADFYDIAALFGHPPKVIWLRTGNTSTNHLIKILSDKKDVISEFLTSVKQKEISCLEIK